MKISNSEIGTYLDCKRRWYFQYYLELKKKDDGTEKTDALHYGTRIHLALENWYIPDEENRINPRKAIREIYSKEEPIVKISGADMKKYEEDKKSSIMLIDHYMDLIEKEKLDAGLIYVSAEQEYEMELDNGVIFRGKLDAIVERESDGARYIIDHKSYKAPGPEIAVAHLNPQFLGYMLLYRENNNDYLSGGIMNVFKKVKTLTRSKTPIISREFIRHTKLETDNYAKRLRIIGNEILNLRSMLNDGGDPVSLAYPHATNQCSWKCPFMQACGLLDDGSYWQDYIEANYETHNVNARYLKEII